MPTQEAATGARHHAGVRQPLDSAMALPFNRGTQGLIEATPNVYRLVGSIALFALAAFILFVRWQGMRTGELMERGAVLSREKNPGAFQFAQVAYAVLAIFAVAAGTALALGLL